MNEREPPHCSTCSCGVLADFHNLDDLREIEQLRKDLAIQAVNAKTVADLERALAETHDAWTAETERRLQAVRERDQLLQLVRDYVSTKKAGAGVNAQYWFDLQDAAKQGAARTSDCPHCQGFRDENGILLHAPGCIALDDGKCWIKGCQQPKGHGGFCDPLPRTDDVSDDVPRCNTHGTNWHDGCRGCSEAERLTETPQGTRTPPHE